MWMLRFVLLLLAIGFAIVVALWWQIMWVKEDKISASDVVFVLAGGHGERLERAIDALVPGDTDLIVTNIGDGPYPGKQLVRSLCKKSADFRFQCFALKPQFDSTRGEASQMTRIAIQNNWKSVVVSTTDYHLFRSRLWFRRCFQGTVIGIAGPSPSKVSLRVILHEIAAVLHMYVLNPQCYVEPSLTE